MESGQAAVEAKRLRERGKRLWKNYRWTNKMRDDLDEEQGHRCAGCGRLPKNAPLNIDHKHFKIYSLRIYGDPNLKWMSSAIVGGREFVASASTKAAAEAAVRSQALPHSVRGLLCPGRQRGCNRLLGRIDNIPLLEAFLAYLKNPPAKKILDKYAKS